MNYFTFDELEVGDTIFILDEVEPMDYEKVDIVSIESNDDEKILELENGRYISFAKTEPILHEYMFNDENDLIFSDIIPLLNYVNAKSNSYLELYNKIYKIEVRR